MTKGAKRWVLGGVLVAAVIAAGVVARGRRTAPAPAEAAQPAAKAPAASARWVCPMGEYTGDKPGKCPKCGMTLERKKT